jgi:hypothetical protein
MRLIESIKMEESDLGLLVRMVQQLLVKHGEHAKIFWHTERFSTECYLVVYEDINANSPS